MIESTCENCGELFEATSRRAKYCSTSCKQQAYRTRQGGQDSEWKFSDPQKEEDWENPFDPDPLDWEDGDEQLRQGQGPESLFPKSEQSDPSPNVTYRNAEPEKEEQNGPCYDKKGDCYGNELGGQRNNVTVGYGKSGQNDRNDPPPRYDGNEVIQQPESNPDKSNEFEERRRYPRHFYAANEMFTAQALEQLPRLDQLALKHKPSSYSDEDWFEFTISINGVPLDIYAEARVELEQEQQQAAIDEMNARILRWFPMLLEFAEAEELEVVRLEKLLSTMQLFVRSDRFRLIPLDYPGRLELLDELELFTELIQGPQDEGIEYIRLEPTDSFFERLEHVISSISRGHDSW